MDKAGHHSARLVDVPATRWRGQRAADRVREASRRGDAAGKPYYEETSGEGADRHLLAATVVPAVLARCAECHGVSEGDLLGFIRYDLPVR